MTQDLQTTDTRRQKFDAMINEKFPDSESVDHIMRRCPQSDVSTMGKTSFYEAGMDYTYAYLALYVAQESNQVNLSDETKALLSQEKVRNTLLVRGSEFLEIYNQTGQGTYDHGVTGNRFAMYDEDKKYRRNMMAHDILTQVDGKSGHDYSPEVNKAHEDLADLWTEYFKSGSTPLEDHTDKRVQGIANDLRANAQDMGGSVSEEQVKTFHDTLKTMLHCAGKLQIKNDYHPDDVLVYAARAARSSKTGSLDWPMKTSTCFDQDEGRIGIYNGKEGLFWPPESNAQKTGLTSGTKRLGR